MSIANKGIDPKSIVLDGSGRFELSDSQLAKITGGLAKKGVIVITAGKCHTTSEPTCPPGSIVVIRGTECGCS